MLDGVRGFAILLVIAYHCNVFAGPDAIRGIDRAWVQLGLRGWWGVNIFFVLSGFLITGILYDAKGAHGYFRTFYARRVLRIVPIYYLFLAFWFFVYPHLGVPNGNPPVSPRQQWWLWGYLANVAIAFEGGWNALPKELDHFWSLAVEEQFYLAWPLLVFALRRRGIIVACLIAMALAVGARYALLMANNWDGARVLTPACLDDLAAGGVLAMLGRPSDGGGLRRWAPVALPLAVASSLALLLLQWRQSLSPLGLLDHALQPLMRAALFAAFLLASLTLPSTTWIARWLASTPMRTMGKYSYAIYILHQPLMLSLLSLGWSPARIPAVRGSVLDAQLAYFIFIALLSLGIAMITWRVIEKPCLDLKRYFPYRGSSGSSPDPHRTHAASQPRPAEL